MYSPAAAAAAAGPAAQHMSSLQRFHTHPHHAHDMEDFAAIAEMFNDLEDEESHMAEFNTPGARRRRPRARARRRPFRDQHPYSAGGLGPAPHTGLHAVPLPFAHHPYHHPYHLHAPAAGGAGPAEGASYEQLLALDDNIRRKGVTGSALEACSFVQTLDAASAGRLTSHGRCVICLDDFEVDEQVRRLPCLCTFHRNCIDRHLQESISCPICRTTVATH